MGRWRSGSCSYRGAGIDRPLLSACLKETTSGRRLWPPVFSRKLAQPPAYTAGRTKPARSAIELKTEAQTIFEGATTALNQRLRGPSYPPLRPRSGRLRCFKQQAKPHRRRYPGHGDAPSDASAMPTPDRRGLVPAIHTPLAQDEKTRGASRPPRGFRLSWRISAC